MILRPILRLPDPRLRQVCAPVTVFDGALGALALDMLATMYAAPGRGLAGPQIGAMQRLFVMDCGWKEGRPEPMVMANPEILDAEGAAEHDEGCLSVPGLSVPVVRPDRLRLRWQDLAGHWHEAAFSGFAAVCIQHERDHLDGILHIDRATPEVRAALAPAIAAFG